MVAKLSDISAIIKNQIKTYGEKLEQFEEGKIISVGDGIAVCSGLRNAMYNELVALPGNVFGLAIALGEETVSVAIMGEDSEIKEGDTVKRTNKIIEVPVGDALLGRVVDSLGNPIDGKGKIASKKSRPIERIAPGVMARKGVDQPMETGIIAIDSMIPIGRGQRELIIGDRQTGKTAIAIDTIINQKGKNVKCVYVAIGQKQSTIANLAAKLEENGALEYTTIVSAGASTKAPIQYLAPYAGVTIAEEWMESEQDVLIIYDDLSKHAVAYRTMSLLIKRPPGREAYPGDVFYLHSRLLERSCRVNENHGNGSITALPIIETQAGDISAYIPTNVISITDGQIFLMSDLFNAGIRPAVDSGLSVSRVGSSAQIKAMKKVSGSLKLELANYRELQAFAQFGSDLDATTKGILEHGERVVEVLKQPQYQPIEQADQVLILAAVKEKLIGSVKIEHIQAYKDAIINEFKGSPERKEIISTGDMSKDTYASIIKKLEKVTATFGKLPAGAIKSDEKNSVKKSVKAKPAAKKKAAPKKKATTKKK